jgi:molybdopterin-biosynthesis enzyme MoeA-like protein
MLALWHIKYTSPLGKYLPDISEPQTQGDMAFQLILALDDLGHAVSVVKQLVASGGIGSTNQDIFVESMETMLGVKGKLMSASIYGKRIIQKEAAPVAPGATS